MDEKITELENLQASQSLGCEEQQDQARQILTDMKIMVRDVDDFKIGKQYKKIIRNFEIEINNFCAEDYTFE